MADLSFNGKSHNVGTPKTFPAKADGGLPYPIEASEELIGLSEHKNVDGLILSDGQKTYVVKKQGMNPDLDAAVEASRYNGKPVKATLDGKEVTVLKSLNAPDTWSEKIRYWAAWGPVMIRSAISQALGRGNGFS